MDKKLKEDYKNGDILSAEDINNITQKINAQSQWGTFEEENK